MIVSHNPFTSAITFQGAYDTIEELKNKLVLSKTIHQYWKKTLIIDRKQLFVQLALLMEQEKNVFAKLISEEMGKPILESIAEVEKCIGLVYWYTEQTESFIQDSANLKMNQNSYSYIQYKPVGTILGIMPWNFPFWQVFRFAIPTLFVGNTVILKHAPNVQGCALAMQALFERSGFTLGVFLSVFASTDDIEVLISSPTIQGVSFTGSEKAGRAVAKIAGSHLKNVSLN